MIDLQEPKITYIDNKIIYGIDYDWDLILKAYKALNCPPESYDPSRTLREGVRAGCRWYVGMSKRKVGKTTAYQLIGLIMHWLYGTEIQYIRETEDMIAPKYTSDMWDLIIDCGYIDLITDGLYNNVRYESRRWYLCKIEDGELISQDPRPLCSMLSVDNWAILKSGYVAPLGDLIIFDEFIGAGYKPDSFLHLAQIISTIKRWRRSSLIVMLANQINLYSPYFNELCIADAMQKIPIGGRSIITSPRGTKVYAERIEQAETVKRQDEIDVMMYFGFDNPNLASITGDEWATNCYQHIPEGDVENLYNHIYIEYVDKFVRLDIVNHETLGLCCYVHWASRTYPDSIILSAEERTDPRRIYRTGRGSLDTLIRKLYTDNRVYYATNDVGAFVESYLNYIRKIRNLV